jgi:hypothetical protein
MRQVGAVTGYLWEWVLKVIIPCRSFGWVGASNLAPILTLEAIYERNSDLTVYLPARRPR